MYGQICECNISEYLRESFTRSNIHKGFGRFLKTNKKQLNILPHIYYQVKLNLIDNLSFQFLFPFHLYKVSRKKINKKVAITKDKRMLYVEENEANVVLAILTVAYFCFYFIQKIKSSRQILFNLCKKWPCLSLTLQIFKKEKYIYLFILKYV